MDNAEAKSILAEKISELKKRSYSDLCRLVKDVCASKIMGKSGAEYQCEIQAFWDDNKKENLRVTVAIDDGGWRAFFPMTSDFIIAPNGKFVGGVAR